MPRSRCRTDAGQVLQQLRSELAGMGAVNCFVLGDGETDEVAGVVVERVQVSVVNLMPSRDRMAVILLPDFDVKALPASLPIRDSRAVVVPEVEVWRVRVPAVTDAVEGDGGCHTSTISP